MRPATKDDLPAIRAFLESRVETSMFPLSNLAQWGLAKGANDPPRAMRFWMAGDPVDQALGLTVEGMVQPQISDAPASARVLAGRHITGFAGQTAQVEALVRACGLAATPTRISHEEPQFTLDLAALQMPDCTGLRLIPAREVAHEILIRWRADYDIEVLGGTSGAAEADAARTLDGWLAADSHRVLLRGDAPVAMTGFNARLPGIVQIGGVWTPPALRRQGLARRALALHLAEARAEARAGGASRATLFAASDMAARAYTAIGFQPFGRFTLHLFREPQEVRPV